MPKPAGSGVHSCNETNAVYQRRKTTHRMQILPNHPGSFFLGPKVL